MVTRGASWGEHNRNPYVLFVHLFYDAVPPCLVRRAARHARRERVETARSILVKR